MKPKNSPTPKSSSDFCELTIDSLSYNGGRGVGRHEGIVVFVPGTAPGDRVKVRISHRRPRFIEAELIEILSHGPSRRHPPCVVADRCGGCSWQHVEYSVQSEQKQKILRDSLRKIEKTAKIKWLPFLEAPNEFFYRNRIQLQVRDGQFGFFSKRTRDLVSVEKCWIADAKINERLKSLTADELSASPRLEVALRTDGKVAVMADRRDPEAALFSQVNQAQNENLIRAMIEAVAVEPAWIFDLYCGSGNLTVPLAEKFPDIELTAVELSRVSVERAKELNLKKIDWRAGDVAHVLAQLPVNGDGGLIVLDPPRSGCEVEVIDQLIRHSPRQLIYISCNPTTFARDVERLLVSGRFEIDSVQGLDMFPQTEHVELIGSLRAATLLTS